MKKKKNLRLCPKELLPKMEMFQNNYKRLPLCKQHHYPLENNISIKREKSKVFSLPLKRTFLSPVKDTVYKFSGIHIEHKENNCIFFCLFVCFTCIISAYYIQHVVSEDSKINLLHLLFIFFLAKNRMT